MNRRVWRWATAAVLGCASLAPAQSGTTAAALAGGSVPTTAPASRGQAPADAEQVLVIRTSGQPDRRVRVLKVSDFNDGQSVAEVTDVDNGQTFTIPGRMLAALRRAQAANATNPVAAAPPPVAPGPQPPAPRALPTPPAIQPSAPAQAYVAPPVRVPQPVQAPPSPAPLVQAAASRPQTPTPPVQPTEAAPTRTAASSWKAVGEPAPAVTPQALPPSAPTTPAVTVAPTAPPKRDVWSAAKEPLPPSATVAPQPAPTPHPPQTLPSATTPGAVPMLPGGSAAAVPPVGPVVRAQAEEPRTHGYVHLSFPAPAPVPMPQVSEERQPVEPAGGVSYRPRRSIEQQIADETKQQVYDLFAAVRPSVREGAATTLAEGRFGSRPEVKGVLARAAMADPAPSVRAHCIRLLAVLGYHSPEYTTYLRGCATAEHPAVKLAAVTALERLVPRR